jgi:glyoxylase-like metal-dependent hydrolase (beta-lactamase superfamily II)
LLSGGAAAYVEASEYLVSRPPVIDAFFDEATFSVTYLVSDPATGRAAIVDPVLDYDHGAGRLSTTSADWVMAKATERALHIDWVLETHAHADHLTAASHIKKQTGAKVVIGERIRDVQRTMAGLFGARDVSGEGSEFDRLVRDGERLPLGELEIEIMHLPGYSPADVAYRLDDAVFAGPTIFMPDQGTARTDSPGGDAAQLYRSIRRLLALPTTTRLFMCRDYTTHGRARYAWESTVGEQRKRNVHVRDGVSEADFVVLRQRRDETLPPPALMLPAFQVNMRAGNLPPPDANGQVHLLIPVKFT